MKSERTPVQSQPMIAVPGSLTLNDFLKLPAIEESPAWECNDAVLPRLEGIDLQFTVKEIFGWLKVRT